MMNGIQLSSLFITPFIPNYLSLFNGKGKDKQEKI